MKLKIKTAGPKQLEWELPAWIYIQNQGTDWNHFHVQGANPRTLLMDQRYFQSIRSGTVIEAFSRAISSQSELKKRLEGSPLLAVLKRVVGELSPIDQMKVLAHTLLFSEPEILHFKMPSTYLNSFKPAVVEILLRFLSPFEGTVLWEDYTNSYESYFLHTPKVQDEENQLLLPPRLEDISNFESLPFHPFRSKILATGSALSLKVGEKSLELDSEEFPALLGLVNHDLILCLSDDSFEISRKEKKGYFKLDLISQKKKGLSFHQVFSFESIPFSKKSLKRSATPFLFAKLDLGRLYLFHPKTGDRLFPGA